MGAMGGGAAAGGAMGLGKYYADKKAADKDRAVQAQMAQYSPWTGMQAHPVSDPSMFNNVMQGATSGAGMGQSWQGMQNQQDMQGKQGQLIDAQSAYYKNAAMQGPQAGAGSAGAMGIAPVM